jgi:hypothetical protein
LLGIWTEDKKGDFEMAQSKPVNAIPKDTAFQICTDILQKYRGKWYTFAGMQCLGCTLLSKGDPAKMCISNKPGNRGCNLVNDLYDKKPT